MPPPNPTNYICSLIWVTFVGPHLGCPIQFILGYRFGLLIVPRCSLDVTLHTVTFFCHIYRCHAYHTTLVLGWQVWWCGHLLDVCHVPGSTPFEHCTLFMPIPHPPTYTLHCSPTSHHTHTHWGCTIHTFLPHPPVSPIPLPTPIPAWVSPLPALHWLYIPYLGWRWNHHTAFHPSALPSPPSWDIPGCVAGHTPHWTFTVSPVHLTSLGLFMGGLPPPLHVASDLLHPYHGQHLVDTFGIHIRWVLAAWSCRLSSGYAMPGGRT